MKKIINRKPKRMRSDLGMKAYIDCAEAISEGLTKTDSIEVQYWLLEKIVECIDDAAKAGGFFSTEDFITWCSLHNNHK